jgi:hypothetical protein
MLFISSYKRNIPWLIFLPFVWNWSNYYVECYFVITVTCILLSQELNCLSFMVIIKANVSECTQAYCHMSSSGMYCIRIMYICWFLYALFAQQCVTLCLIKHPDQQGIHSLQDLSIAHISEYHHTIHTVGVICCEVIALWGYLG